MRHVYWVSVLPAVPITHAACRLSSHMPVIASGGGITRYQVNTVSKVTGRRLDKVLKYIVEEVCWMRYYQQCPILRYCKVPTAWGKTPLRRCWSCLWTSSPCTCGAATSSLRSCLPGELPWRRASSSSTARAWCWVVSHQRGSFFFSFFNPWKRDAV